MLKNGILSREGIMSDRPEPSEKRQKIVSILLQLRVRKELFLIIKKYTLTMLKKKRKIYVPSRTSNIEYSLLKSNIIFFHNKKIYLLKIAFTL